MSIDGPVTTMRILVVGLLFLLASCESSITRTNDEQDMEKAKDYAGRYYALIQQEHFEEASSLFDATVSPAEGLKLIQGANAMRGGIIDAVTDRVGTKVTSVNGAISHIQCSIELNCIYEQGNTRETLVIEGENFDSLLISGYHVELK
jgi:hypothetical protein